MKTNEQMLKAALDRLDQSTQRILETRGYSKDAKALRALNELIREQLKHANTRSAARTLR